MPEEQIDWKALAAPFHKADVKYRIQSVTRDGTKALFLPYVSSRSIMERLDSTDGIGPGNWKDEYIRLSPTIPMDAAAATVGGVDYNGKTDTKAVAKLIENHYQAGFLCRLSIRFGGEWLTKEGISSDSEIQNLKGGESGALKRAAVKYGIGRYLYNLPDLWIPVVKDFQQGLESAYYKGSYYYYVKPDLSNFGAPSTEKSGNNDPIPVTLGAKPPTETKLFPEPAPSKGAPSVLSEPELQDLLARISKVINDNNADKKSFENYKQINGQPNSLKKVSKMLGCLYYVAAKAVPQGEFENKIKGTLTRNNFGEMYKDLKDILSDLESKVFK